MKTTSDHDQPRRANNMQHNPVVSVRIDQELDRRLTALAEKTHRSRGAYLRAALTWMTTRTRTSTPITLRRLDPRRRLFGVLPLGADCGWDALVPAGACPDGPRW